MSSKAIRGYILINIYLFNLVYCLKKIQINHCNDLLYLGGFKEARFNTKVVLQVKANRERVFAVRVLSNLFNDCFSHYGIIRYKTLSVMEKNTFKSIQNTFMNT